MASFRLLSTLTALVLAAAIVGACSSTETTTSDESTSKSSHVTHSFQYDTKLYQVDIQQHERDGACIRREVVFTSHSRLYLEPVLQRVRAVDQWCDATYVSDFEDFRIMRDPVGESRYFNAFRYRNRVNEDLWNAYRTALFHGHNERARKTREAGSEKSRD